MEPSTSGAHLQQFICALQWVKQAIPKFTELVKPLQDLIKRVYDHTDKRTKRTVSRVPPAAVGWVEIKMNAFESCKTALASQVTLAPHDPSQRLFVYTDASDLAWAGIITQVPKSDAHRHDSKHRHAPLSFLLGRLEKTWLGWPILEKEAYSVMKTLDRMHWLVTTPAGSDLYRDYSNLNFLIFCLILWPWRTTCSSIQCKNSLDGL